VNDQDHELDQDRSLTLPEKRDAPYQFRGTFYEACDCFTVCPCWTGDRPDEGECTGLFAWDIEGGYVDGIDVGGCRAVSLSRHTGNRTGAHQSVIVFVDEAATPEQATAVAAVLTGYFGGPLKELATLLGELLGIERAPIELNRTGRVTTLTVGRRIRVEGTASEGPAGRTMTLNDGKLSGVLGSPAEIGVSRRFRIGMPFHGMDLDLRGRSTMSGTFSYEHTLPEA
jgi:hypothetical protein